MARVQLKKTNLISNSVQTKHIYKYFCVNNSTNILCEALCKSSNLNKMLYQHLNLNLNIKKMNFLLLHVQATASAG